jgi:hypothetical protein
MLEECRACGSPRYKRKDTNIDGDHIGENEQDKRLPAKVA